MDSVQIERKLGMLIFGVVLGLGIVFRIASALKYPFLDEDPIVANIAHFWREGTLVPVHFRYPTLFSYLATPLTLLEAGRRLFWDGLPAFQDFFAFVEFESLVAFFPARLTNVLLGAGTMGLVYVAGRRAFDVETGTSAMLILGVSHLHVFYSGYALPDMAVCFFVTCVWGMCLLAILGGGIRPLIWAGFFAGLAASSKYNGAVAVLSIAAARLVLLYDEGRMFSPRAWFEKPFLSTSLAFGGAFLAGSPGWLLRPIDFINGFRYEFGHMKIGHLGDFGLPFIHHLSLFWHWESTLCLLFALGVFWSLWKRDRIDWVLLALVLPSFLYIGTWQKKSLHYMLFFYPVLALLSGRALVGLHRFVVPRWRVGFLVLCGGCFFVYPMYRLALDTRSLIFLQDNREIAQVWCHQNLKVGEKIVVDWAYVPKLFSKDERERLREHGDFFRVHFSQVPAFDLIPMQHTAAWIEGVGADYLVTSSDCYARFFYSQSPPPDNLLYRAHVDGLAAYRVLFEERAGWKLVQRFDTGRGAEVVVFQKKRLGVS